MKRGRHQGHLRIAERVDLLPKVADRGEGLDALFSGHIKIAESSQGSLEYKILIGRTVGGMGIAVRFGVCQG